MVVAAVRIPDESKSFVIIENWRWRFIPGLRNGGVSFCQGIDDPSCRFINGIRRYAGDSRRRKEARSASSIHSRSLKGGD
jgi:hypothetical protein